VSFVTAPNTPEAIAEQAEQFVRGLESLSGLHLDFGLASLGDLDSWLIEWIDMAAIYDAPAALPDTALVEPIAAYVGEALVRSSGAAWDFAARSDEAFPPLQLANGQRIDLPAAVLAVLQRSAPPAFAQLARLANTSPTP
jgi:hypothetical protein